MLVVNPDPGAMSPFAEARPCPLCGAGMVTFARHPCFFHPIDDRSCPLNGKGFYSDDLAGWNKRVVDARNRELAVLVCELLAIADSRDGDRTLIRRARRVVDGGYTEAIQAGEDNYRAWCAASLDHKAEGTRESLGRVVHMIDAWAADALPANKEGQVHFARAMLESAASEIRAFLAGEEVAHG